MTKIWDRRACVIGAAAILISNATCVNVSINPCSEVAEEATINVAGVYLYNSRNIFNLSGTITFEQEGSTVRVVNTTYDFGDDRALMGEGVLVGNTLSITLVPINGDTDYTAEVYFVFSSDGGEFCVEFSDTNGDAGELGSYDGRRRDR